MKINLQFTPFWKLTQWGFLRRLVGRGCDEYHNPSRYLIVPFVGMLVIFRMTYGTTVPHLSACIDGKWEGAMDTSCPICSEIQSAG